jgi:hypothetical protein
VDAVVDYRWVCLYTRFHAQYFRSRFRDQTGVGAMDSGMSTNYHCNGACNNHRPTGEAAMSVADWWMLLAIWAALMIFALAFFRGAKRDDDES